MSKFGLQLKPKVIEQVESDIIELSPSEFTEHFMMIPAGFEEKNFSFENQPYMYKMYDTGAKRVLYLCGRQIGKSTALGNQAIAGCALRAFFKVLYVAPRQGQAETFSKDRLALPIRISPKLQKLKGRNPPFADNVLYKEFVNNSSITIRFALYTADAVRGVSGDMLFIDELQDVLIDVIPILEQAISRSALRLHRYAGTPKSIDNTIAWYWETLSSKCEWLIPCDACNRWNITSEANIGKFHLICSKCGKQIYPLNPRAQWVSMRSEEWIKNPPIGFYEGYRVSQLMATWIDWDDLLSNMENYPRPQFFNECLALSYDSADRLLAEEHLRPNCNPSASYNDAVHFANRTELYIGLDWGTGFSTDKNISFTFITVGGYLGGKFRFLVQRMLTGPDSEPVRTMQIIDEYIEQYKPKLIGTDYGGGFDRNSALLEKYGRERVIQYQYCGAKLLNFDSTLGRYMVNKTEVTKAIAYAIKRGNVFEFVKWEEFSRVADQFTSVIAETNHRYNTVTVSKTPGSIDDGFHSAIYCFLPSMIHHPRPDIITPTRDNK